MENSILIVGLKNNEKFHYIGKITRKTEKLRKSHLNYQYHNNKLRSFISKNNGNCEIVLLDESNVDNWYDNKLNQVVEKHSQDHPLLNADWMKEGKRGYWEGKKKDLYTLDRLSESKFKKVLQYDSEGNLIKIWPSIKETAIKIFKDYKITNGSAESKIYDILSRKRICKRFYYNSYWFKEDEIKEYFKNNIPHRLNLTKIIETQEKNKNKDRKKHVITQLRLYTINQYDNKGNVITRFNNKFHAALILKIPHQKIAKICNGRVKCDLKLKYGPKTLQPIEKINEYKHGKYS